MSSRLFQLALLALSIPTSTLALETPLRLSTPPRYQGRDLCPTRCLVSGASPGNWSLYHNLDQLDACDEAVFYHFSLYDDVDNAATKHRIHACTSYGTDWDELIAAEGSAAKPEFTTVNATFQIGQWLSNSTGNSQLTPKPLVRQLQQYLSTAAEPEHGPLIVFTTFDETAVGLYVGRDISRQGLVDGPLSLLEHYSTNKSATALSMQFCQQGQDAHHTFGIIVVNNGTLSTVREAVKSWSRAECLSAPDPSHVAAGLPVLTPLYAPSNVTQSHNATSLHAPGRNTTGFSNSTSTSLRGRQPARRGTCSTVQVASGDSCSSLAQKCGITPAEFTDYNPSSNECSTLQPGEYVCCSAGTLPNNAPQKQADGTCATYTVQSGDYCAEIAAAHDITVDDIIFFNWDTWGWNGCSEMWVGIRICLSLGNPPMPAPVANAVCGPQVPGTPTPPSGTNISTLNPCPLNACCDVWAQCGTTAEFCTETRQGAPGTAAPGTDGCISNCGQDIVQSSKPSVYRKVGFFEGYNLNRECLFQTVDQIDTSEYTHVFFAFGVLTSDYEVQIPTDVYTQFEWQRFLQSTGSLKILSIGGWAFSTDPSTYMIFREGVMPANRIQMAANIAKFISDNGLDGVNIDWEYPGAPDIPGIPPGSPYDGPNYVDFLADLRYLMGSSKEISIAAPASYWYLKNFPIQLMISNLDYVIYMTYDLHGQWDSGNRWSQEGCVTGNCLRTDVNLTETMGALVMITKAGVPSNKVIVGITSYGRSFAMAEAGCYGPDCQFLGTADDSQATPGPCTQTAGYIGNAEIQQILADPSRVNANFVDADANTNILVYDDTQWVGWMGPEVKAWRTAVYAAYSMGGTTDWATDLKEYNPAPDGNWAVYKEVIAAGGNPMNINWQDVDCTAYGTNATALSSTSQWAALGVANAWSDFVTHWNQVHSSDPSADFMATFSKFFKGQSSANCGTFGEGGNCSPTVQCWGFFDDPESSTNGAAGYLLYNSFVYLHTMYTTLRTDIVGMAALTADPSYGDLEDVFTPVPPPTDPNSWLVILTNILALGLTAFVGPAVDAVFDALPAIIGSEAAAAASAAGKTAATAADGAAAEGTYWNKDNVAGLVGNAVAYGTSIAAAQITPGQQPSWTQGSQANLGDYLGSVVRGWTIGVENTLNNLFNGSAVSVSLLGNLIADGSLITSVGVNPFETSPLTGPDSTTFLNGYMQRAFFSYAIPAAWQFANYAPFVLDSGLSCDSETSLSQFMSASTQEATKVCGTDGNAYYLVSIPSSGGDFVAPAGADTLGPGQWGNVTAFDLVQGSVNSYQANGNAINGPNANSNDPVTMAALINGDITTPGNINIPVCSGQVAQQSWSRSGPTSVNLPGYPCNPDQGATYCYDYTYSLDTTDAQPLVSDCQQLLANMAASWSTNVGIKVGNTDIQSYGTCNLRVWNNGVQGLVDYDIGAGDVYNIISTSIAQYAKNGRVGTQGTMVCPGDATKIGHQNVGWDIT